jgi:tetratricopeptide (TPR) repeat protein
MVEPNSTDSLQSDELQYGSINDITQRLLLWGKRTGMGLLRVEFSSEFARQAVLQRLQSELAQFKVPFKDIVLPTYQQPAILADTLEQALDQCESGVVSISGFATAFSPNIPLAEAMYSLNIRRERLAQRPLRQIWWMTPVFYQTALHAMPDLMSWFSLRLELTESVKVENLFEASSGPTVNIDDARRRSLHLIQRFEQALEAGGDSEELLRLYLLPALEALAEVGAQKDLRDLTSQFEGYLSHLRASNSLELADVLERLSLLYYKQGRYLEAEPLLQKSLILKQNFLGLDHTDVSTSLNNLATLYQSQGRYNEAEQIYLRSLEIRERQLGAEHPVVASSLNNLATLYRSQGRHNEAEPLYVRSLEIWKRQLGPQHLNVAQSLNNLAGFYRSQGRYSEAEPLYLRSLEIRERHLGIDHPDTAQSLNNLALLYYAQGLHSEAEQLYLRSLDTRERQLGTNHPDVATSLNNLALLYKAQGRYGEAEPLYVRSLEIEERQLGTDHPDVAAILNNLALLYEDQGRYAEAESLLIRTIAIRLKVLGENHPDTVNSLRGLELLKEKKNHSSQVEAV